MNAASTAWRRQKAVMGGALKSVFLVLCSPLSQAKLLRLHAERAQVFLWSPGMMMDEVVRSAAYAVRFRGARQIIVAEVTPHVGEGIARALRRSPVVPTHVPVHCVAYDAAEELLLECAA